MARQDYKSVYFPDAPGVSSREKNVTVAFGVDDSELGEFSKALSSEEVRAVIGHQSWSSVKRASVKKGIGVSSYIKSRLRAAHEIREDIKPYSIQQAKLFEDLDPVSATFRGGHQEPLHSWFPYLEGYSPSFVRQVLGRFAPTANVILDPFGGTGTTVIAAAQAGLTGHYCEVNPLLNLVIEAKKLVLQLDSRRRESISKDLQELASEVPDWPQRYNADEDARQSYRRLFGESIYFSPLQMEAILVARSAVDRVARRDVLLGKLALIASFSCLLASSNLIRRGDVRFKTAKEAERPVPLFLDAMVEKLVSMSADLVRLGSCIGTIAQLTEDAKILARIPRIELDAVLTSPPYLNGTNYIRNTKIELWFARILRDEGDLRRFRTKTITSGINDVNNDRIVSTDLPDSVLRVARQLERDAYDVRIAKMISGYFTDMKTTFGGVVHHLARGARVMIDIGDSEYAGVHVPTHTMLDDLLKPLGLEKLDEVTLRTRRSRAGKALSQLLLVYQFKGNRSQKKYAGARLSPSVAGSWDRFKQDLPHQTGVRAKRNWGHTLHSACSYQGKMKPSLAASLVETFLPKTGRLLDPFAGVGTIPFEGALRGHQVFGFDISPMTIPICRAKLEFASLADCLEVIANIEKYILRSKATENCRKNAAEIKFNGPLASYFSKDTFDEILKTRRYFQEHPPITPSQALVFASMLHILHGNRPYALSRNSHPLTPFAPTGPSEYRPLAPRLREKVLRCLDEDRGTAFRDGNTFVQDATEPWPALVDELDAIITSPPFFDSIRFHLGNWMRLWFSGWEAGDFQTQPKTFVDERQKVGFDVYEPVFRQAKERLKTGGVLVMHLGKSKKCDMAAELTRVGARWFSTIDIFDETVAHCESHGVMDKGTVSTHQYLVMM